MLTSEKIDDKERLNVLKQQGVKFVRLQFSDLHGISRGKVFPISEMERLPEHGIAFAGAVMTVDLRHNVVAGFETGLPDIIARPDLSTLVQLPWEPEAAWCIANLEKPVSGMPFDVDSRNALKQVIKRYEKIGLSPVVGPELEFYLCKQDGESPEGLKRYLDNDSHVYTTGSFTDPQGILEYLLENAAQLGLKAYAANHEYGRSQFEINLKHSLAMDSADRAFLFKTMIKELSARKGLLATFMGKPWNDDEGSGMHLHISLARKDGSNAFCDPQKPGVLTDLGLHFVAGVLSRSVALTPLLNPTVNSYRRINAKALAPTRVNWGYDNRFTLVRIPNETGAATRVEIRSMDGTANPYLAYAGLLLAGLEGIEKKMQPPKAIEGFLYGLPEEEQGTPLPTSLQEALAALEQDEELRNDLGSEITDTFIVIKKYELDRYNQWVSDWELREYAHHL
ncbi:glutamine synthetase family protein [Ferviditalea candida]|uniref:Glutamine synthetase family protein n=1 Tax=Ferviditalea candida TaxID=3108399 RepID=A0ABU5ZMJ5_9BACL|nr:glutamine synthetase family protein [Paenibacillaceae bacterium T2]